MHFILEYIHANPGCSATQVRKAVMAKNGIDPNDRSNRGYYCDYFNNCPSRASNSYWSAPERPNGRRKLVLTPKGMARLNWYRSRAV